MKKEHQNLWLKVARFSLDDPNAAYPFSKKLGEAQGWFEDKTLHVIAEYKKFMFLCMTAPNGASPSPAVDECWHLHLTFTANYAAFCAETAGKFIHHNPSKGGTTERHRHTDWYEETLKNYVETFQQIPPHNIWTPPEGFNAADFLPKSSPMYPLSIAPFLTPKSVIFDNYTKYTLFFVLLAGLFAVMAFVGRPFSFVDGNFLTYYLVCAIALVMVKAHIYSEHKERIEGNVKTIYERGLNAYQTAFFVGGNSRFAQTVALELIEKGIINKNPEDIKSYELMVSMPVNFDDSLLHNPLYLILQTIEKQTVTRFFINECLSSTQEVFKHQFDNLNIMGFPQSKQHIIFYLFVSLGIWRVVQGLNYHKPVGYLVAIIVVYSIIHFSAQLKAADLKDIIDKIFKINGTDTPSLLTRYAIQGRDALAVAAFTDISLTLALVATDWGLPNRQFGHEGSNSFTCGGAVEASSGDSGGDGDGGDGDGCGGCGGCGCGD